LGTAFLRVRFGGFPGSTVDDRSSLTIDVENRRMPCSSKVDHRVIFVHQPDRAGTILRLQNSIANRVASHVRLLYFRLVARTSSAREEASGRSAEPRPG
jgi:hypothetical protein